MGRRSFGNDNHDSDTTAKRCSHKDSGMFSWWFGFCKTQMKENTHQLRPLTWPSERKRSICKKNRKTLFWASHETRLGANDVVVKTGLGLSLVSISFLKSFLCFWHQVQSRPQILINVYLTISFLWLNKNFLSLYIHYILAPVLPVKNLTWTVLYVYLFHCIMHCLWS